eukprot:m.188514 g.188514  ORF g.188514 m.188514 type:complete len:58 (-) comp21651_c0_seq1:49-222(-)
MLSCSLAQSLRLWNIAERACLRRLLCTSYLAGPAAGTLLSQRDCEGTLFLWPGTTPV